MKFTSISILTINIIVIAISMLVSKVDTPDISGIVAVLLYPIYLYSIFLFFPSAYGIFLGIKALKVKNQIFTNAVGIIGNIACCLAYVFAINKIWPALMGI
jgi:hypothetical protein